MLESLHVLLPGIHAILGELALNEAHVVTCNADKNVERGHHGVIGFLGDAPIAKLSLLLVGGGAVGLGVLPAWAGRRARDVSVQHASALENSDGVGTLTHEDQPLIG